MILSDIADIEWFRDKRLPLREAKFRTQEITLHDINPLTGIIEPARAAWAGFAGNVLRKHALMHGDTLISFNSAWPCKGICGYVNGDIKAVPGVEFCRIRLSGSGMRPFALFFWLKLKAVPEAVLAMTSRRKSKGKAPSINLRIIGGLEVDFRAIEKMAESAIGLFEERRRHAGSVKEIFASMRKELDAENLELPEEKADLLEAPEDGIEAEGGGADRNLFGCIV